jgi:DHA2 family multidrug resistance protein
MSAGLAMAPMGALAIVAAPIVGNLSGRIDPRLIATFGVLVFASVFFWRAGTPPDAAFRSIALPQFIVGIGMTSLFLPMTALSLADIPPGRIAAAAGLQNFVRTLFGAFGTAVSTSYWDNSIVRHHSVLTENVSSYDRPAQSLLGTIGGMGLEAERGLAFVDRVIDQQAAVLALEDYMLTATVLVLLMTPLVWLAHRPRRRVDVSAMH